VKAHQEVADSPTVNPGNTFYTPRGKLKNLHWESAFHKRYQPNESGHPRLRSYPGNSLSGAEGALKSAALQDILSIIGKESIFEIDMANVHYVWLLPF
jgi:hypothetical protein